MSYTVEDFEFSSADDCGDMRMECPYATCWWEFEITSYHHGLGDLFDAAQEHLERKHND